MRKIEKAGAYSEDTAVTFEEADLNMEEMCWINYFAGVFLGSIKKTKDHRYYI